MKTQHQIIIRKALITDQDSIWKIIQMVISSGDTYVFSPDSTREYMIDFWCGTGKQTYVAELDGVTVGTFLLRPNQPGLGSHVANAAFMTHPDFAGKGVGTRMGEFALEEARRIGYRAMQFNMVVKTNTRAILLWKKLGFEIIGEIPDAFRSGKKSFSDALIMWRKL